MLHIETFSQDYRVRLLTLEDAQTVLKVENGFIPTGVETDNGQGIVVVMELRY